MLAVLSLTFCVVGCAKSVPGDLLCCDAYSQCNTALAAHTFNLNELSYKSGQVQIFSSQSQNNIHMPYLCV